MSRLVDKPGDETTGRPHKVAIPPSCAAGWLMPGLADFRAGHSDIGLVIEASSRSRRIGQGDADPHDRPWMQGSGANEATELLERFGIAGATAGVTPLPGNLMTDAARDRQGVAFTERVLVIADIAAGH